MTLVVCPFKDRLSGPSGAFSPISWLCIIQSRHDAYQIIAEYPSY